MNKKSAVGLGHTRRDALKLFGMVSGGLALHGVLGGVPTFAWASTAPGWQASDMPSLIGKRMLVTGGSSGMGFEDALALSRAGAQVIIAARNGQRGVESIESIERIRAQVPDARLRFEQLDLADLSSVRSLAQRLNAEGEVLDVLINNAAIMAPPQRGVSRDGFEMQLATNFLGHFALTGLLLPSLRKSSDPRVVTLASIAVNRGSINFDDLQSQSNYNPYVAYAQSKLACLMMAFELQRRSLANDWGIRSVAAHPGVAVTELVERGPGLESEFAQQWAKDRDVYHSAAQGALSSLFAATAAEAEGGRYYGPTGEEEKRGPLGLAKVPEAATDADDGARLWSVAERLTSVRYG
ncbi:short-chain dehydrogenase [Ectopseudomonas composti]|uniref:Short-chain dehydrogenase n=1 Tax=Ectopseudomonas composti TaxID=658457 RepID=A0ABN0SEP5_9GAMM|nr:SDR family oxidoreductase [Pseudomonas composti]EZH82274.1 short-chain dehydrogenase [Pseudomonas composti]